jgi:hypothetical protein
MAAAAVLAELRHRLLAVAVVPVLQVPGAMALSALAARPEQTAE